MELNTDGPPYSKVVFVFLLLFHVPSVKPFEELCHSSCFCLDTYFDCKNRGLKTFPSDFPVWVERLNLTGNELATIEPLSVVRLPKLNALSLDANKFTSIPKLGRIPQLEELSVARNDILQLHSEDIVGLENLKRLDVNKNRIEALNNSFSKRNSLEYLNLASNNLDNLAPGWLEPLDGLIELNIAKNRLRQLSKGSFGGLVNLEKLDLSRNKLEVIDSLRFQELRKLKVLNLRRNVLSNFSDAVFYGLETLEHLYLDGNNLQRIEKRWLYGLPELDLFNASRNQIGTIEEGSWDFMQKLQILDLSFNRIERINAKSFLKLDKLKELDLSNNALSGIEEESFISLSRLEKLNLSNNHLSWVLEDTAGTFNGLKDCIVLNLASNKIRSLHPNALDGLEKLIVLNLSENPILWLSEKAFSQFPGISLVLYDVDTLVCDCESGWLRTRLLEQKGRRPSTKKHTKKKSVGLVHCALPENLHNMSIVDVSPQDLICSESSLRPEFVEEPKQEVFLMKKNGTLACSTKSFSNHTLTWWKDREELPKQLASQVVNLYRMQENGATVIQSTLQLQNVSWVLAGSYQCVAENSYGVVYSATANVTVHVYPTFIKTPANVTVRLGSNAKLECAAEGSPTPEIAFQKDGGEDFPAALDRRFHVMTNDDAFFIMEVKVADMGVYCCSAKNAAGEIKAYASVTVYDTPSFSESMKDENVVEGSNALLSCYANGSPKPLISWSKDGLTINDSKDKRYHFSENGSLLIIKDAQLHDGGLYECQLSNAVGTARGHSTLTILPSASGRGSLDTSGMTIIFIIIIVFCIVGTSGAWVVVIYRNRTKRRNESTDSRRSMFDNDRPKSALFDEITQFSTNYTASTTICPDIEVQSARGNDYTSDVVDADPMTILPAEHESFIRRGRKRDPDAFSTFGTRASSSRIASHSQLGLHDSSDIISLSHHPGREFLIARKIKKVPVPSPPDKDSSKRRSGCHSNSSSSGYSSCGIKLCQGDVECTKQSVQGSINSQSEDLEVTQDNNIDNPVCISTPV